MPYERTDSTIVLKHPNGSSAEILFYGATVVSWKSASPSGGDLKERLFVSSKSPRDGSKPIRGGIPVVFPIFGPPTKPEHARMPQHGFARSTVWKWEELVMDNESGVSVRLILEPTAEIEAVFPHKFVIAYVVTLAGHQLSTDFHLRNQEDKPLAFQVLLHTYYAVEAAKNVRITPLKGLTYINKVKNAAEEIEERDAVDVLQFTDSVYKSASKEYEIDTGVDKLSLKSRELNDVVVWNPGPEAGSKIADMEDGGWERYVCVEPGAASYFIEVEGGKRWIGGQTISIL